MALPDGVIGCYVESDKVAGEGGGGEGIDQISWTINSAFRFTRMEAKEITLGTKLAFKRDGEEIPQPNFPLLTFGKFATQTSR